MSHKPRLLADSLRRNAHQSECTLVTSHDREKHAIPTFIEVATISIISSALEHKNIMTSADYYSRCNFLVEVSRWCAVVGESQLCSANISNAPKHTYLPTHSYALRDHRIHFFAT